MNAASEPMAADPPAPPSEVEAVDGLRPARRPTQRQIRVGSLVLALVVLLGAALYRNHEFAARSDADQALFAARSALAPLKVAFDSQQAKSTAAAAIAKAKAADLAQATADARADAKTAGQAAQAAKGALVGLSAETALAASQEQNLRRGDIAAFNAHRTQYNTTYGSGGAYEAIIDRLLRLLAQLAGTRT
jgi:hypothetical protein